MLTTQTIEELEDELSRPTTGVLDTLRSITGDVLVLGAGGKMGPTLARMVRRGLNEIGDERRRVIAVSRFSSTKAASELQQHGVETISCDLMDRKAVRTLPDSPNIIFMAGQKFGTNDTPELTWVMNTLVPAIVAERYAESRIVVFSTGCVYSLVPADGLDQRYDDAVAIQYPRSRLARRFKERCSGLVDEIRQRRQAFCRCRRISIHRCRYSSGSGQ